MGFDSWPLVALHTHGAGRNKEKINKPLQENNNNKTENPQLQKAILCWHLVLKELSNGKLVCKPGELDPDEKCSLLLYGGSSLLSIGKAQCQVR